MSRMTVWDNFQSQVTYWGNETFPKANLHTRFAHLRSELDELEQNPSDLMEWADVLLLLMQSASDQGYSMCQLLDASKVKLLINQNRTWGEPNEEGYVEHVE